VEARKSHSFLVLLEQPLSDGSDFEGFLVMIRIGRPVKQSRLNVAV